jgi:pimeloyl-ACP methyl ester carboxylesterase
MSTAPQQATLAFERHGSGVPVVLLHGLTFDRRSWRPIVDRLGERVSTIAIDLPAHGTSPGPPCDLDEVAAQVHGLLESLEVADPVVVGHSMSGGVAMIYAGFYPVRGVVTVDSPVDVRPFAQLVRSMAPALRGPGFADAFAQFERSMGLDLVPEPQRSAALDTHKVSREVVLGYWDELLRSDAEEVQARVTENAGRIDAPCLAVFGHELSGEARDHLRRLVARVQVEEWPGLGHFVHLADADRFAARLEVFVDFCDSVGSVR